MPSDNYFFRIENVIACKHNVTPVKAEAISLKPVTAPHGTVDAQEKTWEQGNKSGNGPNHRYDKQTSGTSRTSKFQRTQRNNCKKTRSACVLIISPLGFCVVLGFRPMQWGVTKTLPCELNGVLTRWSNRANTKPCKVWNRRTRSGVLNRR